MNLARRILSNSLLILIVVGLVYAYTKRDELYPYLKLSQIEQRDKKGAEPTQTTVAVTGADVQDVKTAEEAVPAPLSGSSVTPAAADTAVSGTNADAVAAGQDAGKAVADAVPVAAEGAAEGATDVPAVVSSAPAPSATAVQPMSVATPTAQDEPVAAAADAVAANKALQQARQSYWQRDVNAAIENYRLAIKADPNQPDAYGELGNIYLSQGRYREAAEVYYEAATRLLEDGRGRQALPLLHIMYRLDPERASRLERTLRENGK